MWKKKHIKFLTKKDIDKPTLINVLKQNLDVIQDNTDKRILDNIINDFEKNNFSLLTAQEVQYLEKNPSKQWTPYLIHRQKFNYYENSQEIPDFPIYLILEPVSACNLRCPFCHQIDENFNNNKQMMGMMNMELFKKIIDEAYEGGTNAITLTCRGEPTLHPKLGEMLEYCSGKFLELKMNTNATRLNEKLIHQILKNGMTELVFSVDSYYKEEFESLRVGAVFEQVLENIKKFKEIKENFYPNSLCITRISGVDIGKQDPIKFKEFWEQYVDYVVMVKMLHRWDVYNNSRELAGKGMCHYLGRSLSIYFDGSVIPCDIDYEGRLCLDSVKEKSIRDIWNGEKYSQLIKAHKNGNRSKYIPCDRCPIGTLHGN